MAELALNPNVSLHHLNQPLCNAQAESRASVLARRRSVDLRERLEDDVELVRGDANAGVRDREQVSAGVIAPAVKLHAEHDLAALRELDRIPDEIDEDLTQSRRISQHPAGHVRHHMAYQLQTFLVRS